MARPRGDDGAAVVDFVLVSVLVLALFLLVLQVGLVLHVRNVLVASAAEGARYGAAADRSPNEGAVRANQAVAQALGDRVAGTMACRPVEGGTVEGAPVVDIRCTGPLPLVFLPAGPLTITVHGHALEESR
ncbi:MAG: pilus assembly protein TadE [Frankiales bacterium]|nr:pilus assembly protein TadE [Frankiales bacterium]